MTRPPTSYPANPLFKFEGLTLSMCGCVSSGLYWKHLGRMSTLDEVPNWIVPTRKELWTSSISRSTGFIRWADYYHMTNACESWFKWWNSSCRDLLPRFLKAQALKFSTQRHLHFGRRKSKEPNHFDISQSFGVDVSGYSNAKIEPELDTKGPWDNHGYILYKYQFGGSCSWNLLVSAVCLHPSVDGSDNLLHSASFKVNLKAITVYISGSWMGTSSWSCSCATPSMSLSDSWAPACHDCCNMLSHLQTLMSILKSLQMHEHFFHAN